MTASTTQNLTVAFNNTKPDGVTPVKAKLRPMTFRVTDDERSEIKALAGSQSVSEYVREQALGKRSRRKRRKRVVPLSHENAARILGLLGQSGILANLARIADAAETGSLPVTDELTEELHNACALVIAIRHDLIEALGVKVRD